MVNEPCFFREIYFSDKSNYIICNFYQCFSGNLFTPANVFHDIYNVFDIQYSMNTFVLVIQLLFNAYEYNVLASKIPWLLHTLRQIVRKENIY